MDVLGSLEDVKSMLHKRFLHDLKEKKQIQWNICPNFSSSLISKATLELLTLLPSLL